MSNGDTWRSSGALDGVWQTEGGSDNLLTEVCALTSWKYSLGRCPKEHAATAAALRGSRGNSDASLFLCSPWANNAAPAAFQGRRLAFGSRIKAFKRNEQEDRTRDSSERFVTHGVRSSIDR
jgi:hypothetical protein